MPSIHKSTPFVLNLVFLALSCGGQPTIAPEETNAGTGGRTQIGTDHLGGNQPTATIDINGEGGAVVCDNGDCGIAGSSGTGSVCGDGVVAPDEGCDDANTIPGDGCGGRCQLEFGYECPVAGQPCNSIWRCGDGKAGPGEGCDDGNPNDGDGCSSNCLVEAGYVCNQFGVPCVKSSVDPICGNRSIEAGESCDDGNVVAGDGCSGTCHLELGWLCPNPGQPCAKNEYCGDGVLNNGEQCDDGNLRPGDCCSGTCRLEANCVCTTPSPALVPPHQVCLSTIVCGDGKVTGSEICDDGGTASGDGCAADCGTVESGWSCPPTGGACSKSVNPCGNAQIDTGEECDDGQVPAKDGDGCTVNCRVEADYVCPTPGTPCKAVEYCGDGKVNFLQGETCDDGAKVELDGCSASCHVEPGYRCTGTPSKCVNTLVCGDKKILGNETCDDGNSEPGDGCSGACQVEDGYHCALVGISCQPICGDGKVRGREQCDDHNVVSGDGCSSGCTLESPTDNESSGWICPTPGAPCTRTTCGNGTGEGSEQCDDGNNDMGDGCSPFCRREPSCPVAGGACSTACGDGILLPIDKVNGQECDDGNTVSGDGCSDKCKVESGYACPDEVVTKSSLLLPIVFRDFKATGETNGHPDFEAPFAPEDQRFEQGIVQAALDSNGKPQHALANKANTANTYDVNGQLTSPDYFKWWYRDTATYNKTILQTLTFNQLAGGVYEFSDSTFFPIDGLGWGNYTGAGGGGHNFHFTSEVRYWFEYRGGETLRFRGDDDVWVFVNRQLAVDLGGVHEVVDGSVVLDAANGTGTVCENKPLGCANPKSVNLGLTIGSVYEIVVFQAERHTTASNYRLTLGNFAATRSHCSPICGDGIVTATEQCDLGPGKNVGGYGGCLPPNCTLGPVCGDGHVDADYGEICDDGVNSIPYGSPQSGCAPGCVPNHYCGDGNIDSDFGETCDLKDKNSATAYGAGQCLLTCQPAPFCGDGLPNSVEQCDLGTRNGAPTSACDTLCHNKCGNGVVDPGEQCDNGAANENSYGHCRTNCTLAPYCGDGAKNGTEQCDDGKNDGSYGTCKPDCTLAPYCGDAVVSTAAGEVCDLGNLNVTDKYGLDLCTIRCLPAPFCGDGAVDAQFGEQCDNGVNNSNVAPGTCKLDCSGFNTPAVTCGNGTLDVGEQCDDGSALNGTAASACDVRCRFRCGNGLKEPGEQCDDGKNDGTYGTCKPDCTLADFCGDSERNGPEQCDLGPGNEVAPYGKGKCTKQCTLAPYCGDQRVLTPPEECDGQRGCEASCRWGAGIIQ